MDQSRTSEHCSHQDAGSNESHLRLGKRVVGRTKYPKIFLSVLQTSCDRIFRFLTGFFFFYPDTPPINQKKKCQRNIFFYHSSYKQCVNLHFQLYGCTTKLAHYEIWTPLFCLHLLKPFWTKDAEHFIQKQCTMCATFADANAYFLEWLLFGRSLFPQFLAFFLLFITFVQSLVTDSFEFKPAKLEYG